MTEKTLTDPLSGAEIKQILADEIMKRLNGDCTLGDDLAYAGFTAKFDIKINFLRSLMKESLVWGVTQAPTGHLPNNGDVESAGEAVVTDTYTSPAPNVARQEHQLPIPVLVQTPTGPVRKRVQIERVKK